MFLVLFISLFISVSMFFFRLFILTTHTHILARTHTHTHTHHTHTHTHTHIYIYIYKEREREKKRGWERKRMRECEKADVVLWWYCMSQNINVNLSLFPVLNIDITHARVRAYTHIRTHMIIYIYMSKVCHRSKGWSEGSLFNSYYIGVMGNVKLLSQDCSPLPLINTL